MSTSFIFYIFIQVLFEHILCARYYFGHLKHSSEQNNQDFCLYDAHILLEKDIQKLIQVIGTTLNNTFSH